MRTAEERLEVLHCRAHALRKEQESVRVRVLGGTTGTLAVGLVALLSLFGKGGHDITDTGYAGTSLLSESAGGYVLVAVVAFAVGVAVTALLIRYSKRKG